MGDDQAWRSTTRRDVIAGSAALALAGTVPIPAGASPAEMQQAMRKALGTSAVKAGRVRIELPELTENGNSAPITIEVESPMTVNDHVTAIHIFSEKNPVPHIVHFHLGPRAGRARVRTNIRLADTQYITAVAVMSDGTMWSGRAYSEVTAPACIDESRLE
ncbi:MAG: thiosulfate oxidation carrier protein SoxY [Hyphomicrobiaceae bacterium]